MRLVEIKDISYDQFHRIRCDLWSDKDTKFGPISCEYDNKNKWMRIWLWDQKYIPDWIYDLHGVDVH